MNIDYSKIKGKKVLLFSGGMDCYMINELEKPDVLLYIDNHSKYSQVEKAFLKKMQEQCGAYPNLVFVDNFINMSDIERDDYIIPARNAYFILKAAEYGDEIILGATLGDRSTDKDKIFAKQMTDLLNHIYEASHWVGEEARHINVNFKYKDYTKQDLIKALIEKRRKELGISLSDGKALVAEQLMRDTISCYDFQDDENHENKIPCGICKPCTRKWLAILGATGWDMGKYFATNPRDYFTPEVIEQWITKESGPNNRGRESQEIIEILEKLRDGKI